MIFVKFEDMIPTVPFINDRSFSIKVASNALKLQLSCNNWRKDYPYTPEVDCYLWHTGDSLWIRFEVREDYVAALASHDNEKVSKDSCVEFFISLDDKGYYNLEANCIGKILLSHRKGRKIDVKYADDVILSGIVRKPSLGSLPFNCRGTDGKWTLDLEIPVNIFFNHEIKTLGGLEAKCNIYKCGDDLPNPHYLSLYPIDTETPDFHRPEFFQPLKFEKP